MGSKKPIDKWAGEDFYAESTRILNGTPDENLCGAMMLSALKYGTSYKSLGAIAKEQGVSRSILLDWWRRLRANNVFRRDGMVACGWLDEDGGLAFTLDVAVAMGLLAKSSVAADAGVKSKRKAVRK